MLIYIAHGTRRYHQQPVIPHPRHTWEFQAVAEGQICPVIPDRKMSASSRRLWVFPPNHIHGWTGIPKEEACVGVAHFDHVPNVLHSALNDSNGVSIPLSVSLANHLIRSFSELEEHTSKRHEHLDLRAQHLLLELTLLVLDDLKITDKAHTDQAKTLVQRCMGWYAANITDRPTVHEMAEAHGYSASQLRRLFVKSGVSSPFKAMHLIQLERAKYLLNSTDESLSRIAYLSGFASLSAFSRAIKQMTGSSPSDLREQQ
ncbi:HTH-type transcriptional repressor of iron proteins A [Poriferisphaera corsica]|uniref:HTH-type transcriptional repressor of iron proteins A n=1 Tax=Poriferisphaera corsica TaxID=2528020 RepID=A0A517YPP6_9BACT|nr:AraC family transcriptional regulator [Poriferisphaera corsica]QDU32197.1 HTH-type transcriptional repressor of iron proteins A [Poriferisphaera corsica]